ncbi:hypothetical protein HRI_000825900 [Hibiscus trionum]|uniref:Uncharacterized protein n=1 Tax=Hibiscus trionum TaxID=183268 RepID=A0A9W7H6B6_HIBTR|nr:hypothetical protein HRI_000825900 [Hibiscus trionum]
MGNVRVSSQGSFFVVGHRVGFGRAALSDQGPGHKGPGTIQVRRTPEMTAMSRNLTHWPKRRANTRTATNVEHTTMPPVFISWKSPAEERAVGDGAFFLLLL